MKKINRLELVSYLLNITNTEHSSQELICGKSIYFLQKNGDNLFQLEFIPATKNSCSTIYLKGIYESADMFNGKLAEYVSNLNLGRDIFICTEGITRLV